MPQFIKNKIFSLLYFLVTYYLIYLKKQIQSELTASEEQLEVFNKQIRNIAATDIKADVRHFILLYKNILWAQPTNYSPQTLLLLLEECNKQLLDYKKLLLIVIDEFENNFDIHKRQQLEQQLHALRNTLTNKVDELFPEEYEGIVDMNIEGELFP